MRWVIECIDRVGVAQEILSLLVEQSINLEGIELQKVDTDKGLVFLKIESISAEKRIKLVKKIKQLTGVKQVRDIHYLPQERQNLELRALLSALPTPVLSIDLQGNIEFANAQAQQLLLPLYQQSLSKKQQQKVHSLHGISLVSVIANLNKTKWYAAFLQQVSAVQRETVRPISRPIQIEDQIWRIDMLPIELWESEKNKPLGCVVALQSQQSMQQIDIRQFMIGQYGDFDQMVAESHKMKEVIEQAKKFAILDAPLLIQGETGTGKDVFAKACHHFSFRRNQKFIAVNCAGLPEAEAETEMFGHAGDENGSIGFFEYANGGTVLLDNVAELSLEMQAKLLRFLNDGSFRRVGEDKEIQVDVRVICTSQEPLSEYVAQGRVREDLFHRLNVLTLNLPPLRERQDDLVLLTDHFIQQVSQQLGIAKPNYDEHFLKVLKQYRWPGNLRELYNAIYRACSLVTNNMLSVKELGLPDIDPQTFIFEPQEEGSLEEMVNHFEASLLRKFYAEYPSTRKLAQRLGISHTAIANKLRMYGIGK